VKNEKFEKSLPFFEKAHELNAEDLETVKALWEVYRQLRNPEKTMEFKEKMDALGG
jgi:tetratricopeptide (TPR) repeat protein